MLTAETITDEQVRFIRQRASFNVNSTHAGISRDARADVDLCDRALANDVTARHCCAALLNAWEES